LISKRGQESSPDWKITLRRNIAIVDMLVLLLSVFLTLSIRFPEIWNDELTNYELRSISLAFLVLVSWLYFLWFNGSRETKILGFGADEYKRLINATLLSFTSVALVSYIFKLEISRLYVISVFPFGLFVLFVVRRILRIRLLRARNQGRFLSRVLLLHSGEVDPVEQRLARTQHSGFNIVHKIVTAENLKFEVKEVVSSALTNGCDKIMVGQSAVISAAELRKLGWALEAINIDIIVAPAITEIAGPRLKVSNVEGLPLLHLEKPTFSGTSRVTKRVLDLTLSAVGLIVISPFLLIVAIAIKSFDRGPVLYTQKRIGQNNKEFNVYKFRTMYPGSHEKRAQIMAETNKDPRLAKDPQDPRITKPGLFLRRWSIDEIPQVINVVKGEMSLVGPRPPLAEEVNQYEKSETRRLLVKPGLTGLWQVSGRSELDWEDAVRLDLYYVENWSLTLDILIIIRTAAAVWRGEGAY
jgi:exopolysaccharide biosynthesis polyprenyl glycosylphosphotransferase